MKKDDTRLYTPLGTLALFNTLARGRGEVAAGRGPSNGALDALDAVSELAGVQAAETQGGKADEAITAPAAAPAAF